MTEHPAPPVPGAVLGLPLAGAGLLVRSRIQAQLEEVSPQRLIVLEAGSGYGKTSALVTYAQSLRAAGSVVMWLTADEEQRQRRVFWENFLAIASGPRSPIAEVFQGIDTGSDTIAVLPARLTRAFNALSAPLTLIVDSGEDLAGSGSETDLFRILDQTPGLNLVLATRRLSDPVRERLAVQDRRTHIGQAQLRFDRAEIAELAVRRDVELSPANTEYLARHTDGWPVAVRAILEDRLSSDAQERGRAEEGGDAAGEPGTVRIDAAMYNFRRFLLESVRRGPDLEFVAAGALMSGFTVAQLESVAGRPGAQPVIAELERRGLGQWSGSPRSRFRLHPLLREALRAELDAGEPERQRELYRRLARWFLAEGDYGPAIRSFLRAEDYSRAGAVLRDAMHAGEQILDLATLDLLSTSAAQLRGEPLLALLRGLALYASGHHARAVASFARILVVTETRVLNPLHRPTAEDVWLQGVLMVAVRLAGRFDLAGVALAQFRKSTLQDGGHLARQYPIFDLQISTTLLMLGRLGEIAELFPARGGDLQEARYRALFTVALAQAVRGELGAAAIDLEEAWESSETLSHPESYFAIDAHPAAALLAVESGRAHPEAEYLRAVQPHWSTTEQWPVLLWSAVQVYWQAEGAAAALRYYLAAREEKRTLPGISEEWEARLGALHAEVLLALGHLSEAREALQRSRQRQSPRLRVVRSRLLLQSGHYAQAAAFAAKSGQLPQLDVRERVHLLLIESSATWRQGLNERAQAAWEQAWERARGTGLLTPFAMMDRAELGLIAAGHPELIAAVAVHPEYFPAEEAGISLSARELTILQELITEATVPEIAALHSVSINTVRKQVQAVYRKLGVHDREAAVTRARERRLL